MKNNFLYKSIKNEWQKFHSKRNNKKIKLHEPTYGVEEIFNFTKQLITTNVTMGEQVESFEKKIVINLVLDMQYQVILDHQPIFL